jgi:penicillin G amidase
VRGVILGSLLLSFLSGCGSDESLGEERLPSSPVDVLIDDNGVPHVYGATDRDAFYGAGYMMGVHRMLQVDMTRRCALGRWAEVLPDHLADDQLARLFDWRDLGRDAAKATARENPEEWGIMKAWTAGLNRRIAEVRSGQAPLPYGFGPGELDYLPEPWDPSDVLVVAKMTGFGNDLSLDFELFSTIAERLYPEAIGKVQIPLPAREVWTVPPEDRPPGLPSAQWLTPGRSAHVPAANRQINPASFQHSLELLRALASLRAAGSNNWAIDGRFSDNGRPLLAGDPHLGFGFPGVFYALGINSADQGGNFDVVGFSFPGLPGVSLGHTEKVAWSPTTAFGDVMDIWEVPAPDYQTIVVGGETMHAVVREETIRVRGKDQPVGEGEDQTIEERDVPGLGPLLPSDLAPIPIANVGHELLFRWTGFDQAGGSRLLGLNRARSIDEFDQAVDQQTGLNFNMLAADATGITYRVGMDVPDRDVANGEPWKVMNGEDPKALWSGQLLPRDRLPRGRARERGWLATANNDPFGFTANGRLDDDPWYYGAFFAPGWRAGRAASEIERLTSTGKVGVKEMEALQLDLHSNLADDLLPLLEQAFADAKTDPALSSYAADANLATLLGVLQDWDRRMDRPSSGAVVFNAFAHFVASTALEDDLGALYAAVVDLEAVFVLKVAMLSLRGDYPESDALLQKGRDATLLDGLSQTADFLVDRFGSVDPAGYQYSDLHVTKWNDALGAGLEFGENPSDGGETTVNVSPHHFLDGSQPAQRWTSHYGPILRLVVSFDDAGTPHMLYNFPLGNVADPASPHFDDMLSDWLDGHYREMHFSRADVEAASEERITLR